MSGAAGARPVLSEVVEELAGFERRAGSEGEHRAAEWIARRLRASDCEAEVEEADFHAGYAGLMRGLSLAGSAAGLAALAARGLRPPAAAVAALAGAAMADDIANGPRLARRLIQRRAPTGLSFDDRVQAWVGERFPRVIERTNTAVPLWWGPLAAHGLIAAGALSGRRRLALLGLCGTALSVAAFHDIARSPVVPGANDNLSGVAVLVGLAERLRAQPVEGLRMLFVSCGAEEVIQGGIRSFARAHFPRLARERTWFLNLETVGSPQLILLEGEGPLLMEDYHDK